MGTLEAHIRLSDELGLRYALLAGDPARIGRVAQHLENVRELLAFYTAGWQKIMGL